MNTIPDAFDHVKQRKKLKATSFSIAVPNSFQRQSETDISYKMQTTARKSFFIVRRKNIPLCVCMHATVCTYQGSVRYTQHFFVVALLLK